MRDYWLTQYILATVGWGYLIASLGALGLALSLPRRKREKLASGAVVLALVCIFPIQGYEEFREQRRAAAEFQRRQAKARALFEERCKTAGEKVMHSEKKVQGVVLMNWRSKEINLGDQFKLDDPYGSNCQMEGCIRQLLRPTDVEHFPEFARRNPQGFSFVETTDPRDGVRYRYSATIKPIKGNTVEYKQSVERTGYGGEPEGIFVHLERRPIATYSTRMAIAWKDVSTQSDRENWIAGGSMAIIDMRSGETLAERTGFLFDPGLGGTEGWRSPWAWAKAYGSSCPPIEEHNATFAFKVLNPQ